MSGETVAPAKQTTHSRVFPQQHQPRFFAHAQCVQWAVQSRSFTNSAKLHRTHMNSIKVFIWFMYPVMEMMWRWNTRSVVNYLKIILAIKIVRGKQTQKKKKSWEENPIYKSASGFWVIPPQSHEKLANSWVPTGFSHFKITAQLRRQTRVYTTQPCFWSHCGLEKAGTQRCPPAWPLYCLGLKVCRSCLCFWKPLRALVLWVSMVHIC